LTERKKAIQLFSGGLDSILAARIVADEGFEVIALHIYNGFNCSVGRMIAGGANWTWEPAPTVTDAAERLGIRLVTQDITEEFRDVLLHPRHGYGSGANPCIDCRIMILQKARKLMEQEGAAFVFTGEVAGQRPMSQNLSTMRHIEKVSGMTGYILRPLSAKLLEPTIPEQQGVIDRDHLYDIQGRSRKRQQELARAFGIDFYPQPGGGCLLTDPSFSIRFHDLLAHTNGVPGRADLETLKTGRHLRLPDGTKVIVGRTAAEHGFLDRLLGDGYWRFEARDFPGPAVYAMTEPSEDKVGLIASVTARYGKGSGEESVVVTVSRLGIAREITVAPARPDDVRKLLIAGN